MSTIAEAVGTAVMGNKDLSLKIQKAQDDEVLKCSSEGITDPEVILKRKLEARARAKREIFGRV